MSGIFPQAADGGLPPNLADPSNPSHAYSPVVPLTGTAPLYYGNGCDVRLRPEVLNSLISEIEALCDKAELSYNAGILTNLQIAARYLIQRGRPRGAPMIGGTSNQYVVTLDPPATRYNDFMTLSLVPDVPNTDAVTVNLNGLGSVPILQGDGTQFIGGELLQNLPLEVIYYQGAFYALGLEAGFNRKVKGYFHAFSTYSPQAFQTLPGGVWTKVTICDNVSEDTEGWYDPTLCRFHPQKPGFYFITGGSSFGSGDLLPTTALRALRNGILIDTVRIPSDVAGTQYSTKGNGSFGVFAGLTLLNGTTDFVELFAFQDSLDTYGSRTVSSVRFNGWFVGR